MNLISRILFLPAGGLCAAFLPHATAEGSEPLSTFAGFRDYGLEHSPALESTYQRFQSANERARRAGALPDPQISTSYFVEEIQTRTGPQEQRFGAKQSFPWPGTLGARTDAATWRAEATLHDYRAHRLAWTRALAETFHRNVLLQEERRIASRNLELLGKLREIAEEKLRAGGTSLALLRIEVEEGRMADRLHEYERRSEQARYRLNALVGRDPAAPIATLALGNNGAPLPDISALRAALAEHNPELAALASRADSARASEKEARLSRWPEITLGVDYFRTGDAANPMTPDSGRDPWSVTVGLSLPIWSGKNDARVGEALAERREMEYAQRDREQQLLAGLMGALDAYDEAQVRVALYRDELLPKAQQALEVVETKYATGEASIVDWIDTQRTLLDLERIYWEAVTQASSQRIIITTLTGGERHE